MYPSVYPIYYMTCRLAAAETAATSRKQLTHRVIVVNVRAHLGECGSLKAAVIYRALWSAKLYYRRRNSISESSSLK
jgi:hypothetical protein